MVAVNTVDGIKYGFQLMGYLLGVGIVAMFVIGIGSGMVGSAQGGLYGETNFGQLVLGAIITLVGVLTLYAGMMGLLYKVIADGVERGNRAAS